MPMRKYKKCPNCGRYRAIERGIFSKSHKCNYCGASSTLKKRQVKKTGWFFQRVVSVKEIYDTKGGEKWAHDWRNVRAKVLEKAGYKCSRCGARRELHVHHRKPVAEGGTDRLSNLVVLCANCHRKVHGHSKGVSCLQVVMGIVIVIVILSLCAMLMH